MRNSTSTKSVINRLLSSLVIVVIWHVLASWIDSPIKLPTPLSTAQHIAMIVFSGDFLPQVGNSLRRIVIGYIIAFGSALIIGVIAGFNRLAHDVFEPIVITMRAMPTMATILLCLIWLDREVAPILVGTLIVFPIVYTTVVSSIRQLDRALIEMADCYKLDASARLRHLYLPSIRRNLLAVATVTMSLNIKVNIAAEVLSQPARSIGTGLQMEKVALNTAGVIAWGLIAIGIAALFEWLIERVASKWPTDIS